MTSKSWLTILFSLLSASAYASSQAQLTQLVQQAPTVTAVQPTVGVVMEAVGVPLTITILSPTGAVVPDGTVMISDGSAVLASLPVVNGSAMSSTVFSSVGDHHLTACYSGDTNFLPSCSSQIDIAVAAPYTLHQSNPSAVIENARPFVDELSIIPAKGFVGVVRLACDVPSDHCTVSPASVSFSGDGKVQVVQTSFIPSAPVPPMAFILFPILGFLGFRNPSRRRPRGATVALLLAGGLLLGLTGCGPVVAIPFAATDLTMQVSASSGSYSQAVTYQIQVDTDLPQQ